jgi:hypothetical protein
LPKAVDTWRDQGTQAGEPHDPYSEGADMGLSGELAALSELFFVASCMVNGLAIDTLDHATPIKDWDAVQAHCWRQAERQRHKLPKPLQRKE